MLIMMMQIVMVIIMNAHDQKPSEYCSYIVSSNTQQYFFKCLLFIYIFKNHQANIRAGSKVFKLNQSRFNLNEVVSF